MNEIKTNREVYLDLAKFFAMIMMVAGHTFFELASPEFYSFSDFPWNWWNFARGKTAPMFLFLSGTVHTFANFKNFDRGISNSTLKRRINMALILLFIGYLLNSPINSFNDIFNLNDGKLYSFYQINILHIFGIGLFVLALIYRFAKSINQVFIISFIAGFISLILAPVFIHNKLEFLPLFIQNYLNYYNGSIFVLFPYLAYLFFGTCFGITIYKIQKNIEEKNRFYIFLDNIHSGYKLAITSIFYILIGTLITKLFIHYGIKLDLRSDLGTFIRNVGIILFTIFLMKNWKISSEYFKKLITILSKRAIYIYVVHLFIIYGIGNIKGLNYYYSSSLSVLSSFAFALLVIISSILITLLLDYLIQKKTFKYYLVSAIALYSLFFILQ